MSETATMNSQEYSYSCWK